MTIKVLLDTDIGNDIDDAVCLAYLLAQPQCELMGITTVTGEAEERAKIASSICLNAGYSNIPIFPGSEEPLLIPQKQQKAVQASALCNWNHQTAFPSSKAIDFMRQIIYQNPQEIHLLSIGPLTNIALLFKIDAQIPNMLASYHFMCGKYTNAKINGWEDVEWNAKVDPHACQIIMNTKVGNQKAFGLDVTTQLIMEVNEVKQRFTHPFLKPVLDFSEIWFKERNFIAFHDILAGAALFKPKLCSYERGEVIVDCCNPSLMGETQFTAVENGNIQVAVEVDRLGFFEEFFSVFK